MISSLLWRRNTEGNQGGRGWHFDSDTPGNKGKGGGGDATPYEICTGSVRGSDCGPIKIEGLLTELDAPSEYHFDPRNNTLYLYYNATSGTPPPKTAELVVPLLQQLVAVRGEYRSRSNSSSSDRTWSNSAAFGPPSVAVANVTFHGVGFRDAQCPFLWTTFCSLGCIIK
jgi:hypothetical protein